MLLYDEVKDEDRYDVDAKQMETFEDWSGYIPVKKNDLEARIIYTGGGDSAQYNDCGGGLRNWEKNGIRKEEYVKWHSEFPYILLLKGQSYVEKRNSERKPEAVAPSKHIGGGSSMINLLGSVAAKSCLEMDFPRDEVKQAIGIYCQRNGDLNFKAKDLCEILFEIEENQDKTCSAVIDIIATPVPVASFEDEDFPVLYNSFIGENQMCKMCMYKQDHVTLLAYHHLVSCPQCAIELSQAICMIPGLHRA
ncbi:baculoviral IAP repeat-containing protein 7-A-like isoform X1 [Mercenaria mercenaria]|uniref:baculoviral IAP repeat-containing protein 7-A-like isoform X1 n=1 Tax=Mercenaria mercenaria TaxID=6596 RepID=UPI00234ED495|nr:baculoviral IAP repeat-containing protein 7-A-like isoform X1 [Mercenaria mercenaria]XP_053396394.1 baculoviral IAP repeat-containing protein 7-A-like isoform X1 [Mercenaria mercenaria]